MARLVFLLALLGTLVLPSVAEEAEEPELWIVERLVNATVAEAIETIADLGELDVSVEERVRKRRGRWTSTELRATTFGTFCSSSRRTHPTAADPCRLPLGPGGGTMQA